MARRRRSRKQDSLEDVAFDIAKAFVAIVVVVLVGWGYTHPAELEIYSGIAVVILIVGIVLYFVFRGKQRTIGLQTLSDDEILAMLRGVSPSQFEQKMADMFAKLGYKTEVVGGANDGGIDVVAYKDGKKYFIQCKKFMTREVTPHDVRDFLGAITNVNNPADKGYFVTTNGFTLMAEKAAEGNPRIELIDGTQLVQYYKMAYGEVASEQSSTPPPPVPPPIPSAQPQGPRVCPQCGGKLELRVAHQGSYAGHQFWGCSNFPSCRYIEDIEVGE